MYVNFTLTLSDLSFKNSLDLEGGGGGYFSPPALLVFNFRNTEFGILNPVSIIFRLRLQKLRNSDF